MKNTNMNNDNQFKVINLTKSQVSEVYNKSMKVDFPDNERKPLAMILKAIDNGTYECLGITQDDVIVGYAFFVKTGNDYLFDYLAVIEEYRNKGVGQIFLKYIAEYYKDADSVIVEVEDPSCAGNEEERSMQTRRLGFYLRNGYQKTGICVKLFGVDYVVIEMGPSKHTKEEIRKLYDAHYRAILPKLLYKTMVKIKDNIDHISL